MIAINYTESISPNAYPIVNYTIDLVDLNKNYVQKIADNYLNLSYVWNSTEVPDGKYFIRVRACDNISQCSYGYSENITIDNTKPIVEIISPENKSYDTSSITLSYYANDTYLDKVFYSLNDGTNITITGPTTLILDNGNYKLTLYARDKAGNENSSVVYFTINVSIPVTPTAPSLGAPTEGVIYIPSENETIYFPTLNATLTFPLTIIPKELVTLIVIKDNKTILNKTISNQTTLNLPNGTYTLIFIGKDGSKLVKEITIDKPMLLQVSVAEKTFSQIPLESKGFTIDRKIIVIIILIIIIAVIYFNFDKIKNIGGRREWAS